MIEPQEQMFITFDSKEESKDTSNESIVLGDLNQKIKQSMRTNL